MIGDVLGDRSSTQVISHCPAVVVTSIAVDAIGLIEVWLGINYCHKVQEACITSEIAMDLFR